MLRLLVFILIFANGAYYAWSNGLLRQWGMQPTSQSEPQRMTQQIEPQRIEIQKASSSPPLTPLTPEKIATNAFNIKANDEFMCLKAGPLSAKQSTALKETLSALMPASDWRLDPTATPARWLVYMGKYPDSQTLELKKLQLNRIKVPFQTMTEKSLAPGLSLGSHASQEAANQALARLFKQGVRTARVLQESPGQTSYQMVILKANKLVNSQLDTIKVHLAGAPLLPCK